MKEKRVNSQIRRCLRSLEDLLNILLFRSSVIFRKRSSIYQKQKVFLSRADSIGDFVLFSSCLAAYREMFSEEYIVLLVQDITYSLAETCPYVDEVWQINHRKFRRNPVERFRWYFKILRSGFGVAINTVYSTSFQHMECLIGFSGAARRIGYASTQTKCKRTTSNPYFTELVPEKTETVFEMVRNFEMLRYLGYEREFSGKAELWISKKDLLIAEDVRNKFHNIPYAILFPGAGHPMRVWLAENFIQTISCIFTEWPMCWLICGSTSELDVCQEIQKSLSSLSIPSENYAGKTSLREMYGLLKGASMYLGNDTMAAHLAAAAEVPSVCILGGAYYGRFYPYPENSRTVSVSVDLSCQGCNWVCSRDEVDCIISIPVEKVVHAARNLLQATYAKQELLENNANI